MPKMIEYMLCLIENTIILMFFNSLMERRFKSGLFIIPIIFINATIVFFCTALNVPLRSIILVVIIIIGCCVLYKGAIHIKSALSLTVLFLFNIIDIIFGLLSSLVLGEHVYQVFFGNVIQRVILCLIIKTVDALAVFAVYKMFSK